MTPMAGLARLRRYVGLHGWRKTAAALVEVALDWGYDRRHGTDTAGSLPIRALTDVTSPNKDLGAHYEPSRARALDKVLRSLATPPGSVFVDFGCGKGRALLVAARHPFARVVGVEFSPELCAVARSNAAIIRQRQPATAPIEVIHDDATDYLIRPDENVFYFFNPFAEVIMARTVDNLVASLRRAPRAICVIYNHPLHRHVFDRAGCFTPVLDYEVNASAFVIYVAGLVPLRPSAR